VGAAGVVAQVGRPIAVALLAPATPMGRGHGVLPLRWRHPLVVSQLVGPLLGMCSVSRVV
ncbi:MAG: hypothetical protein RLZZ263_206, partial [Cyanobacteriota bacterium]